jgi:hypothetical protein
MFTQEQLAGLTGPQGPQGETGPAGTTDYNNLLNKPTIPSLDGYATESFVTSQDYQTSIQVNTAIQTVVDTAPEALNTLKELAAALDNDASFASTVTNALATKANISSLATVATSGSYNDLSNKPVLPDVVVLSFKEPASRTIYEGELKTWLWRDHTYGNTAGECIAYGTDGDTTGPTLMNVGHFYLTYSTSDSDTLDWITKLSTASATPYLIHKRVNGSYAVYRVTSVEYNKTTFDETVKGAQINVVYVEYAAGNDNVYQGNGSNAKFFWAGNKPLLFGGSYSDLTNKPSYSTVATTGDYNDLLNKPNISSALTSAGTTKAPTFEVHSSNFTAVSGGYYAVNTTSGIVTATLPASPSVGDSVHFVDHSGTWVTNRLRVIPLNDTVQTIIYGGTYGNGTTYAAFTTSATFIGFFWNGTNWRRWA